MNRFFCTKHVPPSTFSLFHGEGSRISKKNKDSRKPAFYFLVICLVLFCTVCCGMEEYQYLEPVRPESISMTLNTTATIRLPSNASFDHYAVYYRIYVSDIQKSGGIQYSQADLSSINPALYNDYRSFEPYTHDDNITTANIDSLFRNRAYYLLELSGVNINSVLGSGTGGQTVTIDFSRSSGSVPRLSLGGSSYNLIRSNGNGTFSPLPHDRFFLNDDNLNTAANATSTINADVAYKSGISGTRYTYASMYIVVISRDNNFTPIYSIPAFIGVFQIPNR
ncbi:hypothetical protein ACYULU_01200 [Breznakiellaceae bacterium SP9]